MRSVFFLYKVGRVADGCGAGRYGLQHYGVGTDLGVFADREAAQHFGAGADDDAALQRGVALGAGVQRGAAERDALVDGAVVADFRGFADHHAEAVVDEDAAADGGAGVDFDAGDDTRQVGNEAAQPFQAVGPAPVCPAVHDDRLQAGVTGQHLPAIASCGVALDDAADVVTEVVKHGGALGCCCSGKYHSAYACGLLAAKPVPQCLTRRVRH